MTSTDHTGTPVIAVAGLRTHYGGPPVLDGIDLTVRQGEVVALLGPNGAGKTTLLEILEGYRRRTGGEARVLGADPERAGRAWRARLGIVLQANGFDDRLTVTELLRLTAAAYPAPRPIDEVLGLSGLTDLAGAQVRVLSGGQQRRLDLALGIVGDPALLFLDEPTTGFDPSARRAAWDVVERLTRGGTTVLLTTHMMDEAERLADRIVVLSGGRIVADAPPGRLAAEGPAASIRLRLEPGPVEGLARHLGGAAAVTVEGGLATVRAPQVTAALHAVTGWALTAGVELDDVRVGRASLEDTYLALTDRRAGATEPTDLAPDPAATTATEESSRV